MLFTLGVSALWYLKMHLLVNIPIIAFAITGYSSVLCWRNVANRCANAIEPNLTLMYHRNVKVIDIFLSRCILEIAGATMSMALLTVVFSSFGAMFWPDDVFLVLLGWLLLSWFSVALGFFVGVVSEVSEVFDRVWHVITYLLFPLSGAMFMVDWLPKAAQDALLWLPMVHGVEMIRHGYFGSVVPTYENPLYFASVNMVLTFVGLLMVRYLSLRIEPE